MIEYLSYSSINLYLTCSEAWRRKYIAKEPTLSSPALLFGTATHGTIEQYLIDRAEGAPLRSLADLWPEKWNAAVEREPNCDWGTEAPESHFNEGIRLMGNPELQQTVNRLMPARDDQGLFIERRFELKVPGVPVPVIGYIDLVTTDSVPGDFKTAQYAWSQDKAREEIQPLVYLAALHQMGRPSPGLRFRHYVMTKAKQPKVQVIETQHTYESILWLYQLIQRVWRAIEQETFVMQPGAWLCGPKYCSFWSNCRGRGI